MTMTMLPDEPKRGMTPREHALEVLAAYRGPVYVLENFQPTPRSRATSAQCMACWPAGQMDFPAGGGYGWVYLEHMVSYRLDRSERYDTRGLLSEDPVFLYDIYAGICDACGALHWGAVERINNMG